MGEFDQEEQYQEEQYKALQFAELLEEAEARRMRPRVRPSQAPRISPDLGADIDLVGRLRSITPSSRELISTRMYVAEQLGEAMRTELGDTEPTPAALRSSLRLVPAANETATSAAESDASDPAVPSDPSEPVDGRVPRMTRWWNTNAALEGMRRAGLAAAVLLVLFTGLFTGLTVAAAGAPPESPVYAVKQANESILLDLSWNDELRGNALAAIANHRLNEATYEADNNRMEPAHVLLVRFNVAVSQLVTLTAHAQASNEDTTALVTVVQQTLQAAQTAQSHAKAKKETAFQSDLQSSVQSFTGQLRQHGIDVSHKPGGPRGAHGKGSQNGVGPNGNRGGSSSGPSYDGGQATPTTTTSSTPVPSASMTPGSTPAPSASVTPPHASTGCFATSTTTCREGQSGSGH